MAEEAENNQPVAVEGAEAPVITEAGLSSPENGSEKSENGGNGNGHGEAKAELLRKWVTISPEQFNQLTKDHHFLERLRTKLDQSYINSRLDREREIALDNTAPLSLDVAGFSTLIDRVYRTIDDVKYAPDKIAAIMEKVQQLILTTVGNYGGHVDNFLGDGANAIFVGEQAVQRAATAAGEILNAIDQIAEEKIGEIPVKISARAGIGYGQVWVASYGNDDEKRADLTGPAVMDAELVQNAGKGYQEEGVTITMSKAAADQLKIGSCSALKEGIYCLDSLDPMDKAEIGRFGEMAETPASEGAIQQEVTSRLRFLSRTRRFDMEAEYLFPKEYSAKKTKPIVSTVFIRIPELLDRTKDYWERNALMEEVFRVAEAYRGKVDKVHHDVVMINFLAGSNDANSLEASLKIKQYLEKAKITDFSMSCSRGESLSLPLGSAYTINGRNVVIARRLLDEDNPGGSGEKGGLVVDGETYMHLCRIKLDSYNLLDIRPKGLTKPIQRYVIKSMEASRLKLEDGYELIGREDELDQLNAWYEMCAAKGGNGAFVMVEGEEGIGKTVLVSAFMHRLRKKGVYVVAGRAEADTQATAYAVLRDMFEQVFSLHSTHGIEARNRIVQSFFEDQLPRDVDRLALLNSILGTRFAETKKTIDLAQEDRENGAVDLAVDIFNILRRTGRPAVFALENVQWWDGQTMDFVRRMVPRLRQDQIMLLATGWDQDAGRGLSAESLKLQSDFTRELSLGGVPTYGAWDYDSLVEQRERARLAGDTSAYNACVKQLAEVDQWWKDNQALWYEVMNSVIRIDRADFFEDSDEKKMAGWKRIVLNIARKTQGNFRYVERVLHDLTIYRLEERYFQEKEAVREDGSKETVYVLGPKRIAGAYFARSREMEKLEEAIIESLGPEVANLLRDAAIIGHDFDIDTLMFLSGVTSREKIMAAMALAQQRGLVVSRGQGQYEFWRGQEAAYNSIGDERELQLKHRRMAYRTLELDPTNRPLLVRHFRKSDDYLEALNQLNLYIGELKEADLYKAMRDNFDDCMDILEKIRQRGWKVLDLSGTEPVSRQLSPEEIDNLVDTQTKMLTTIAVKTYRDLAVREASADTVRYARLVFASAHRGFDDMEINDQILWASFYREMANDESRLTPYHITNQLLESDRTDPFKAVYNSAKEHLYRAEAMLDEVELRLDAEGDSDSHRTDYIKARARLNNAFGWLYKQNREYELALERFLEGEQLTKNEQGEYPDELWDEARQLLSGLAVIYKDLGEREKAGERYRMLLSEVTARGQKGDIIIAANNLASFIMRDAEFDESEKLYQQSLELARSISRTSSVYSAKYGLAFIERIRGNNQAAAKSFEEVFNYREMVGDVDIAAHALAELCVCLINMDKLDEAQERILALRRHRSSKNDAEARSYTIEAMLRAKMNRTVDDETLSLFERGITALRAIRDYSDVSYDLLHFGELEMLFGDFDSGRAKVLEAQKLYGQRGEEMAEKELIDRLLSIEVTATK